MTHQNRHPWRRDSAYKDDEIGRGRRIGRLDDRILVSAGPGKSGWLIADEPEIATLRCTLVRVE